MRADLLWATAAKVAVEEQRIVHLGACLPWEGASIEPEAGQGQEEGATLGERAPSGAVHVVAWVSRRPYLGRYKLRSMVTTQCVVRLPWTTGTRTAAPTPRGALAAAAEDTSWPSAAARTSWAARKLKCCTVKAKYLSKQQGLVG